MLRSLLGGTLLLVVLVAEASAASPTAGPRQWLERMSQAVHQLNYDGTFVYSHEGHLQTMRIVHSSANGMERERLISLSGPSREVLRDDDQVTCILSDDNEVMVQNTGPARRLPLDLPQRLETLVRYYRFADGGEERIAGHQARKIVITPLDRFRYGHVFWLHQDKGLLLRAELYDEEGAVVEQLMFTSVQFYDTMPPQLLEPESPGHDVVWQRGATTPDSTGATPQRWSVAQLPPGFALEKQRRLTGVNGEVEHLLFSDGLASVSVFVEPEGEGREGPLGGQRLGAVNAFTRSYKGFYITVMGEVPPVTARRIAESVESRE